MLGKFRFGREFDARQNIQASLLRIQAKDWTKDLKPNRMVVVRTLLPR
jgi:hypothetical protein